MLPSLGRRSAARCARVAAEPRERSAGGLTAREVSDRLLGCSTGLHEQPDRQQDLTALYRQRSVRRTQRGVERLRGVEVEQRPGYITEPPADQALVLMHEGGRKDEPRFLQILSASCRSRAAAL